MKIGIIFLIGSVFTVALVVAVFALFFDQAVFVRKGTAFHAACSRKVVALTFDDGPSPVWTPKILDGLRKSGIRATFFMLGGHVARYPEIAKRVAEEGHEIENHSYNHHVLIDYKMEEIEKQVKDTEKVIRDITGQTTRYFRPPKAWLNKHEKKKIEEMGYKIILWSLNSKDWVTFDDKYMVKYLVHHVRPGDIILFHDSGGAFAAEGGDRSETVKVIPRLVEELKQRGYGFVTVGELLNKECRD